MIVSYGFSRKVHRIIVCSESPVVKEKCNSLVSPHEQPGTVIPRSCNFIDSRH